MIEVLNAIPLAGLMLVVTVGFLLGRLNWRGMSLGPAGGTMGVAIALRRRQRAGDPGRPDRGVVDVSDAGTKIGRADERRRSMSDSDR